jgi:hypothetical protein
MEKELFTEEKLIGIKELDDYSMDQKIKILTEAFVGKRDLASILRENGISEETFYLWKISYV